MARVGRLVRTGRTDRPFLAVRSEINGGMRRVSLFFREYRGGVDARRRRRDTPAARPADWTRSALGQTGQGSCGESKGMVGGGWRSLEKALVTRNRGGVFAGLEEDGCSGGWGRRGTSLGAQGRYGECFPAVKLTGGRLPRSVDGGPRDGGYGARWPGYLRPNRPNQRTGGHKGKVRGLTGRWLVDADVRKEALRGWVVGVEEENVGEARCCIGSDRWRFKWTRGTARRSSSGSEELRAWRGSTRGDLVAPGGGQRRKAMAAGLVGSRGKWKGGSGMAVLRAREGERSSLRALALSGEGRRGVVIRTVEVAQTGTGRRVASEGGERGRRQGGGSGQWPWRSARGLEARRQWAQAPNRGEGDCAGYAVMAHGERSCSPVSVSHMAGWDLGSASV